MVHRFRDTAVGRKAAQVMLAIDAWIDAAVLGGAAALREGHGRLAAASDGLRIRGAPRLAIGLACEALTLGTAGAVLLLALALPAFQETTDDWLKTTDLAVTFLDRQGQPIGRRGILHDDSVPLESMPPYLLQAVLATEDRRFYQHFGIDLIGTMRALSVNARAAGVVQGGSSITQQLAKNLFLSNERTLGRKIHEAFLAVWLEQHLSKREILQLYLDRVYMGGGTFGVEAAARFYFGKSVRDVSLAEAAMLAGLFKAPTKYAPHLDLPAARARAGAVLTNLVEAGYMTEAQVRHARETPATAVGRPEEDSPDWYLDFAYDEVRRLTAAGRLGPGRVFTVKTTIDLPLQHAAEATIEDELRDNGPRYHAHQSAAVVMGLDGGVVAMVGGRDYGASQFNRATEAQRQPGSAFKPFVYLTALMTGRFRPSTTIVDGPTCIGTYCVHNDEDRFMGAVPLVTALTHSLNTVAIKLSVAIGNGSPKTGRARIIDTAHRLGLTTPLEDTVSLPLGADAVTVIDMASAYGGFATGGKRVPPFAVLEARSGRGELVYSRERDGAKPVQVVDPAAVAALNGMLTHVVSEGTGTRARLETVTVAGKTGTTNDYRDAWFCGFTGNFVGAVWYGNDDDSGTNRMTGGTLPAMTWHDIMAFAEGEVTPLPPFGVDDGHGAVAVNGAVAVADAGLPGRSADQRPPHGAPPDRTAGIIQDIGTSMRAADRSWAAPPDDLDRTAEEIPPVRAIGGRIQVQ